MKTVKAILVALAGLSIGATAGILFAPKKGSKTRKQIIGKGKRYVNKLKSKSNEINDSLSEKYQSTRKEAEKLAKKQKAKFDDAKKDAEKLAKKQKAKYGDAKKDAEKLAKKQKAEYGDAKKEVKKVVADFKKTAS